MIDESCMLCSDAGERRADPRRVSAILGVNRNFTDSDGDMKSSVLS